MTPSDETIRAYLDLPIKASDLEALGRRYLEAGGSWLPGMAGRLSRTGGVFRVPDTHRPKRQWSYDSARDFTAKDRRTAWPDLSDPATQGAVLGWLLEQGAAVTYMNADAMRLLLPNGASPRRMPPAEALVAAVEALKGVPDAA